MLRWKKGKGILWYWDDVHPKLLSLILSRGPGVDNKQNWFIGPLASLDPAPCQRTLSCTMNLTIRRPQVTVPCWRTLSRTTYFNHNGYQWSPPSQRLCQVYNGLWPQWVSMICQSLEDFVSYNRLWPQRASKPCPSWEDLPCTMDFDHNEPQWSAPRWRTLSRTADFDLSRSLESAPHWTTVSCTMEFNHYGQRWHKTSLNDKWCALSTIQDGSAADQWLNN